MEARLATTARSRKAQFADDPSNLQGVLAAIVRAKAELRQASVRIDEAKRRAWAASICIHAVSAYWVAMQVGHELLELPTIPDGMRLVPIAKLQLETARWVGRQSANLDPVAAGYAIGTVYTATLPDSYRSKFGSYYTPPSLTARLISLATEAGVDWSNCTVLDPACGGGAFLAPIALRMLNTLGADNPKKQLKAIEDRLTGYELDPFAAWMSQVFLEAALMQPMRAAQRRLGPIVQVRDSLADPFNPERFDLVIGNPPYGRKQLAPGLRTAYDRSLHGHANLYGLFTDLALRLAAPAGVISFVTPTSFLSGQYFSSLRGLLTDIARPAAIEFISARKGVFDDVLQETALAAFRVGARNRHTVTRYLTASGVREVAVEHGGSHSLPCKSEDPWFLPRTSNLTVISKGLSRLPCRLSDYGYKVSTGPLVWNRHKPQLTFKRGPNRYPIIWAESVNRSGTFELRAEKRNHRPYFAANFPRDRWLVSDKSCVLVQRTTAKEQSRRIIAAAMPQRVIDEWNGVVVENHLNMLVRVTPSPRVDANVLVALLNSRFIDLAFRCINGSVAVSAYELSALPLPDVDWIERTFAVAMQNESQRDLDSMISDYFLQA
jgi:adenine-specific DNA-methyltransferase